MSLKDLDTQRSYTAGHFELQIDGHPTTAYLKSVDGGYVRSALVDEPIGPDIERIKHTSVAEIEPFAFDFGLSGSDHVLRWIQESWRKEYGRRSGQVTHANFDLFQTFEHEFHHALITETTFPTLDGSSKDAAYLKIKVHPEAVITKHTGHHKHHRRVKSHLSPKQKLWMCSAFRLRIDGVHHVEYANRIESFTIKQGVRQFYTGEERFPQVEPTKIEFPSITGTIAVGHAEGLLKWYHHYVVKGQADPRAQKSGSLEFLAPDRSEVLFRINLYEVGLHHLSMVPSQANAEQIKRMKFELYVGRMDLDATSLGMG